MPSKRPSMWGSRRWEKLWRPWRNSRTTRRGWNGRTSSWGWMCSYLLEPRTQAIRYSYSWRWRRKIIYWKSRSTNSKTRYLKVTSISFSSTLANCHNLRLSRLRRIIHLSQFKISCSSWRRLITSWSSTNRTSHMINSNCSLLTLALPKLQQLNTKSYLKWENTWKLGQKLTLINQKKLVKKSRKRLTICRTSWVDRQQWIRPGVQKVFSCAKAASSNSKFNPLKTWWKVQNSRNRN